jgi:hypothetical protein
VVPGRALRELVVVEIAAVLAVAVIAFPAPLGVAIPLFVAATLARWVRGRSWVEVVHGGRRAAAIGLGAGVLALGLAIALGTPVIAQLTGRSVEWSEFPVVRGSTGLMAITLLHVGVTALALELALRGWIVERVLELAPAQRMLAILVGAFAEGIVTPGDLAVRCGAGLFGFGLGWIYVSAGRNVVPPLLARVGFACGAVILESYRLIG